MHGIIYQISIQPIDPDDYIGVDTVAEGEMADFDYLDDTPEADRHEHIQYLVDHTLPKGMFIIDTDGGTLVYQGGFAEWRKTYLSLLRTKTEAISEENIMEWTGPVYQLQKAIVNPLDSADYFVIEEICNGSAERSRDLMLLISQLEVGAKIYIGEILSYHA